MSDGGSSPTINGARQWSERGAPSDAAQLPCESCLATDEPETTESVRALTKESERAPMLRRAERSERIGLSKLPPSAAVRGGKEGCRATTGEREPGVGGPSRSGSRSEGTCGPDTDLGRSAGVPGGVDLGVVLGVAMGVGAGVSSAKPTREPKGVVGRPSLSLSSVIRSSRTSAPTTGRPSRPSVTGFRFACKAASSLMPATWDWARSRSIGAQNTSGEVLSAAGLVACGRVLLAPPCASPELRNATGEHTDAKPALLPDPARVGRLSAETDGGVEPESEADAAGLSTTPALSPCFGEPGVEPAEAEAIAAGLHATPALPPRFGGLGAEPGVEAAEAEAITAGLSATPALPPRFGGLGAEPGVEAAEAEAITAGLSATPALPPRFGGLGAGEPPLRERERSSSRYSGSPPAEGVFEAFSRLRVAPSLAAHTKLGPGIKPPLSAVQRAAV
ncbi:hypothetical protein T492DRAFT_1082445 [Pavlovales sp. CCMP2436]|nr:hypothetical protein T492DRAFT_1082445 [Pavlovales sp. CCMP2436]